MKREYLLIIMMIIVLPFAASIALATGDCADYTDLTSLELPIFEVGSTAEATQDYTPFDPSSVEPDCWQGSWNWFCGRGPDVTFKWTAPYSGEFTIHIFASDFVTDLLIYTFTCPEEPVYPDDFICGSHYGDEDRGRLTNLRFDAGDEILVVVDGYMSQSGDFELAIYDSGDLHIPIEMIMATNHFPGLQASIVRAGQLYWIDSLGLANIEEDIPVGDETVFLIASVAKTITGTAVMQLYEDGFFDIDDPVSDHLPFAIVHPAYPDEPITIKMVLSQVGGLADSDVLEDLLVCDQDSPVSIAQVVESYFTTDGEYYDPVANFTSHAPGAGFNYSNMGVTLLGYLVECISGMPFVDYCQQRIFAPLGMENSSFMLEGFDPTLLAVGYDWYEDDYHPSCQFHSPVYPAGYMRTSVSQLSRFLQAIMRGGELYGERILDESTIALMHMAHFPNVTGAYGLLWQRIAYNGHPLWGHYGLIEGVCRTAMFFSPEEGVGAIVFTNRGIANGSVTDIIQLLLSHGATTTVTVVPDLESVAPPRVRIQGCYPNPFNPQTTISFVFPRAEWAEVGIFDLRGYRVDVLAKRTFAPGRYSLNWRGLGASGHALPSGTYIVRLETESGVEARKVMLIR